MFGPIRLGIIEKHVGVRQALARRLDQDDRLHVVCHASQPPPPDVLEPLHLDIILYSLPRRSQRPLGEIAATVRRLSREARVIVLTGYADEHEAATLLAAGATDYILILIDSEGLIERIQRAVDQPQALRRRNGSAFALPLAVTTRAAPA